MEGAVRSARQGELERAVELARSAVDADPKREDAYLLIGSSCEQLEDLACARSAYDRGLEALPKSADLLRERGLLRLQNDQISGAVEDLERAVEIAPEAEAQIDLAFAYLFANAPQQAQELSARSVAREPSCFLCWMGRGEILTRTDHHHEAVEAYRTARELEPDDMDARTGLAGALFRDEQFDAAHRMFEGLVKDDPEDGRLRVQAAQAAMAVSVPGRAVEHLEYLSRANPKDVALFEYLLKAQEAAGDAEGAEVTRGRLKGLRKSQD